MTKQMYGVALAVFVAGGTGFGLAHLTADKPPVPAATHDDPVNTFGEIKVTPEAIQSAAIVVASVDTGGLSSEILTQGTVVATPTGQAVLTARAGGAITRILKRLGDPVKAGETLAVIDSREAGQIASDRAGARARASLAQLNLAREKSLYEQKVSPRADYERAEADASAAQAELRRAESAAGAAHLTGDGHSVAVTSPINGRITSSAATLGAFVQPEAELFRVSDPMQVQIEAPISAMDLPRINPGDRVIVDMTNGRAVEGRIRSVTPALDVQTRTATAVIDVHAAELTPGLSISVRILPSLVQDRTTRVVPQEAVQTIAGKTVVFVRTPAGFKPQPVTLGQASAGRIEVLGGLAAGQSIATRNAFVLKAELGKGEGEDH